MLTLENISKTFNKGEDSELRLFEGFRFHVEKGQFVTIIGSNGSGKSTLFNIICGTTPIDAGKVILDGEDISGYRDYRRSRNISRVFQDPKAGSCSSMTILENMAIADHKGMPYGLQRGIDKKRIDYYREILSQLNMGLENKLNAKVGNLSGGQRQALALILAMKDPKLLLLDEHTAALDPRSSAIIMDITRRQVEENKVTALMITHNIKHALTYGDRLILMDKGQIVWDVKGCDKESLTLEEVVLRFSRVQEANEKAC